MKSALLSKIAMCVCPPAIVATSAVTVPPVKRAVHRLTAPAHAPAPAKPRHVFSAAYDCTPTAMPLSTAAPMGMTAVAPTDATGTPPAIAPTAYNAQPETFQPLVLNPLLPRFGSVPPSTVVAETPIPPTAPSALPEVSTWAMTITGFGAIGWALRRRPRASETTAEA